MQTGDRVYIDSEELIYLCKSDDLLEGCSIRLFLGDNYEEQVAIFRVGGQLYCLSNICPHEHRDSIYRGFIDNDKVICPEHGWSFSLKTGENINPRQGLRPLKSFRVKEKNGLIFVSSLRFDIPKWKNYQESRDA